jgi:hypothetical protein
MAAHAELLKPTSESSRDRWQIFGALDGASAQAYAGRQTDNHGWQGAVRDIRRTGKLLLGAGLESAGVNQEHALALVTQDRPANVEFTARRWAQVVPSDGIKSVLGNVDRDTRHQDQLLPVRRAIRLGLAVVTLADGLDRLLETHPPETHAPTTVPNAVMLDRYYQRVFDVESVRERHGADPTFAFIGAAQKYGITLHTAHFNSFSSEPRPETFRSITATAQYADSVGSTSVMLKNKDIQGSDDVYACGESTHIRAPYLGAFIQPETAIASDVVDDVERLTHAVWLLNQQEAI